MLIDLKRQTNEGACQIGPKRSQFSYRMSIFKIVIKRHFQLNNLLHNKGSKSDNAATCTDFSGKEWGISASFWSQWEQVFNGNSFWFGLNDSSFYSLTFYYDHRLFPQIYLRLLCWWATRNFDLANFKNHRKIGLVKGICSWLFKLKAWSSLLTWNLIFFFPQYC